MLEISEPIGAKINHIFDPYLNLDIELTKHNILEYMVLNAILLDMLKEITAKTMPCQCLDDIRNKGFRRVKPKGRQARIKPSRSRIKLIEPQYATY